MTELFLTAGELLNPSRARLAKPHVFESSNGLARP
jgi:hypothetical protein